MLKNLLCPLTALLILFHTSCRKAETRQTPEKAELESKKANNNTDTSCCEISLSLRPVTGMFVTFNGNTLYYPINIFDTSRFPQDGENKYCLVRCPKDNPPEFEWLRREKFEITNIWLERDRVTPRTCPPQGTQSLWTREQIMYSSGGSIGYETKYIGYSLDELTTINDIMPRIEAEEPIMLMMILEQLKCRFFRRYSGDAPEVPFMLAEEGNFVIAIYVDAAAGTPDEYGNPRPNYSRAAVLQPGWNDREYVTWGQAATSVVRPFYGLGDYYATEDFYNAGPPSKYFFYVYTPDQCSVNGPNCN